MKTIEKCESKQLNLEAPAVFPGYSFPLWHAKEHFEAFTHSQVLQSLKLRGKNRLCPGKKTRIGVFSSLVSLILTLTFKILDLPAYPLSYILSCFPVFGYSLLAPIVFNLFFLPCYSRWNSEFPFFVSSSPLFNHFIPGLCYIYLLTPP